MRWSCNLFWRSHVSSQTWRHLSQRSLARGDLISGSPEALWIVTEKINQFRNRTSLKLRAVKFTRKAIPTKWAEKMKLPNKIRWLSFTFPWISGRNAEDDRDLEFDRHALDWFGWWCWWRRYSIFTTTSKRFFFERTTRKGFTQKGRNNEKIKNANRQFSISINHFVTVTNLFSQFLATKNERKTRRQVMNS